MSHLLVLLLFVVSPWAWSQSSLEGIVINADSMSRDARRQTVELEGHVQIVFKGHHLSCDKAIIYIGKKQLEAQGHIVMRGPSTYAEGSSLQLNYDNNTGTIFDGFVQAGQVVFEGRVIQKTGENDYIADEAHFTSCTNCAPSWGFSGKRIEAEVGGYAFIKYPVLRIYGVPILVLPAILIPLKSDRQSGLLVPSLGYSANGGLSIEDSYFWAISRSQDLTVTAKNYEKRGWKALGDYRYVLTEDSKGQLLGAYIRDEAFSGVKNRKTATTDRWFADYHHYYALPENYVSRVQLYSISDLLYPRDFPEELKGNGDPALENRVSITKNTENFNSSIEAVVYKNLLKTDPLSDNTDAVHRMPEIRVSMKERRLFDTDLLLRADLNYVSFSRDGFGYDDVQLVGGKWTEVIDPISGKQKHDGQFQVDATNRDWIRTGQRLDIKPTLSYPMKIGRAIEVVPSVQYRETQYAFNQELANGTDNYSPTAARRYVQTDISASTTFHRVFGDLQDEKAQRWKHEFEPSLTYSNIPWMKNPNHGFFGDFNDQSYSRTFEPIADTDFDSTNKIQFDYNDRVFNKRLIDLGITNRLIRKRFMNGDPVYRNVVNWRISQSYDFREAESSHSPQPWSSINNILNVRLDRFETYTTVSYNPYASVTNTSSRVKVMNDSGRRYFQLTYTHKYTINNDNSVVSGSESETMGVGAGWVSKYFDFVGLLDYSNLTYKIQSWGYSALFKPPGECWGIIVHHRQQIGAEPDIRFNFNFEFGGEKNKSKL